MTYCPECGCFSSTNEQHCPENCNIIAQSLFRSTSGRLGSEKGPEMLPATTANYFCGYCNKIFTSEVKTCPDCHKEIRRLTESHLKDNICLLSGTAARCFWE